MRRPDALKMIGKRVQAWTSANGVYVGDLVEVTRDRPWRAKVRITGVLSAPVLFEYGRSLSMGKKGYARRGFRPGEIIEVGGVNCHPTEEEGGSYLSALLAEQAKFEQFKKMYHERGETIPRWVLDTVPCIQAAIADERKAMAQSP